ncbi:hypothetical protein PV325_008098 [Microctonus aethiopoides]|nr:hypothetical protein PV325_008098 [Microctonus aethiopoides]
MVVRYSSEKSIEIPFYTSVKFIILLLFWRESKPYYEYHYQPNDIFQLNFAVKRIAKKISRIDLCTILMSGEALNMDGIKELVEVKVKSEDKSIQLQKDNYTAYLQEDQLTLRNFEVSKKENSGIRNLFLKILRSI